MAEKGSKKDSVKIDFEPPAPPRQEELDPAPKSGSSTLALATIAVLAVLILGLSYLFMTWQPEAPRQVELKPRPVPERPKAPAKPEPLAAKAGQSPPQPPAEPAARQPAEVEAQPAVSPVQQSPAAPKPAAPAAKVETRPEPDAPKPAETPPADPKPASPKQSAADGKRYSLQVGAFVFKTNLNHSIDKLKALGYETRVDESAGELKLTRLHAGEYPPADAPARLALLKQKAPDAFSLPEGGRVLLYAGSFKNARRAKAYADKLRAQGFDIRLEEALVPMTLFKLRAGRFAGKAEAQAALAHLKKEGLDGFVVGPL